MDLLVLVKTTLSASVGNKNSVLTLIKISSFQFSTSCVFEKCKKKKNNNNILFSIKTQILFNIQHILEMHNASF